MKVVICHNCGGFGYTQGPRIPLCDEATSHEVHVVKCGACVGVGYLTVGSGAT